MKLKSQFFIVLSIFAISFLGCKNEDSVPSFDISTKETSLGKVLTSAAGKTLYFFTPDVKGSSECTGSCLSYWPVYYTELAYLDPSLSTDKADFAVITRSDGKKQTTFKGWPLYLFAGDIAPGDVKGENVDGQWSVAKTTYSILLANGQLVGGDGKNYTSKSTEGTTDTQYFVDEKGLTLYTFGNDKKNKNNFTKADFSTEMLWSIVGIDLKDLPSTFDKTLFGTIKTFDRNQLTYKGWPLYYFGADNKQRGSTKGITYPRPGIWHTIQKDITEAPL
jgi:predicted lipoprotein with Yx(FWY)xxD motif